MTCTWYPLTYGSAPPPPDSWYIHEFVEKSLTLLIMIYYCINENIMDLEVSFLISYQVTLKIESILFNINQVILSSKISNVVSLRDLLFFILYVNDITTTTSLLEIHILRVHYAHVAANLNSGYSKYAKVARVFYFCTIALRTYRAVLTRAWASRRVDLRERRIDWFSKRVIIFCW